MAVKNWEAVFAIGDRLVRAQAREQQAAESYRRAPNAYSRQTWLVALQEMEDLTSAYLDASMAFVESDDRDFRFATPAQAS